MRHLLPIAILCIAFSGCERSPAGGPGTGGMTTATTGTGRSTGGATSGVGGSGGGGGAALGGTTGGTGGVTSGGVTGTGGGGAGGTATGSGGRATGGSATGGAPASGGTLGTDGGAAGSSVATGGAGGLGSGGRIGRDAGSGDASSGGVTGTGGSTRAGGNSGGTGSGGASGTGASTGSGGGTGTAAATIVPDPSWTCGMADGIPPPASGTLVFRATLQLGATHDVGNTQFGHRRILDVKGGTLTGDKVQATFLTGGLDLELTLSNGAVELEQINILKASDGTLILMRNCGVAPAGDTVVRVVADFEVATAKSLAWLNTGKYVGTRVVDAAAATLQLDVYDVSKVTSTEPKVQLKDPAGVANVSWDCLTGSGTNGATVFTENVTLGSSISIGASKRGNRNIIPITGGTTTGKVAGAILAGGADYQLSGLDARYTLAPSDGEFILVRNCGPANALVPAFEARADGPYAFLNEGKFLSSAPGAGSGGVSITFYERK